MVVSLLTRSTLRLALVAATALALNFGLATTASATSLDCTLGCSYNSFSGALWSTSAAQGTGTGVINSFVQIGGNNLIKDGHNSGSPNELNDELNGHNFARTLGDVPIIQINNHFYYEFFLDINQLNSD